MASNTIGIGIEKTQDTIKKVNKVTEKINQVNNFLLLHLFVYHFHLLKL